MASTTETGHAVNISNFKLLIDGCAALGAAYNPSNTALTVANMTLQWTAADGFHLAFTTALMNAKTPINERKSLFEPLNRLVTRTLNYFKSTTASDEIKKDAKGLADKIRGFGVEVEELPDGTPDPDSVSTSHQSYVQRADTFRQLVTLYQSDASYAPNETDLQTATLDTLATDLKTANDDMGTILAPLNLARVARNNALYEEKTGVIDVALSSKAYVKGLGGYGAEESEMITKIKFRRPAKD